MICRVSLPKALFVLIISLVAFTHLAYMQPTDQDRISIPAIDLNAPIGFAPLGQDTWDVSHLRMNVARLEALPWFDVRLNMVLAGHSLDTRGNPDVFYHLNDLKIGDEIYVYVDGKPYRYVVSEVTNVPQDDLSILYPRNGSRLTLFTCDADSFIAETYQRRDVVIAQYVRPLRFASGIEQFSAQEQQKQTNTTPRPTPCLNCEPMLREQ